MTLIWLFMLAACQTSSNSSALNNSIDSGADQSQTVSTGQMQEEVPDLVLGPGNFFVHDPHVGLSDLSSYKASLVRSFEGTVSGEAQQWSETYLMQRTSEPAAGQLTFEASGDVSAEAFSLMVADGIVFGKSGEADCIADAVNPETSSIEQLNPVDLLSVLLGAEEAGQEDVNGIPAEHYTFDERALGMFELSESIGEIWVASDGGYILKYTLTTTGGADAFGEGIEGEMTWDYELTDVNQPLTLDIPEACLKLMINVPRLPDASNVSNRPEHLSYNTASSLAEATAFYQDQLPALGWAATVVSTDANLTGEQPTVSYLEYTQGDQILSITMASGDDGTQVDIQLINPAE
jgi:hypothetical protein